MKFEIKKNWKGLMAIGEGLEYKFTTKLFSHSSKLLDNEQNIVALLSRSSWWRRDFDLAIDDNIYLLEQRCSRTRLFFKDACIYDDSVDGYLGKPRPAIEFSNVNSFIGNSFTLKIDEEEHWLAILVAICLVHHLATSG